MISRRPKKISATSWWYEDERGIVVVAEHRSSTGAHIATLQTRISWPAIMRASAAYVSRMSSKRGEELRLLSNARIDAERRVSDATRLLERVSVWCADAVDRRMFNKSDLVLAGDIDCFLENARASLLSPVSEEEKI